MLFRKSPARSRLRPVKTRLFVEELEQRAVLATLVVNINADDTSADGSLSLREAIAAVNAQSSAGLDAGALGQITGAFGTNDTIQFANGLAPIDLTVGRLALSQNVLIDGGGDINVRRSTADGTPNFEILQTSSGAVVALTGLTISNGVGLNGGGIQNSGGILTVTNCTIRDNTNTSANGNGAGIENNAGTVTVIGSTISNNAALQGGGGLNNFNGTMTIANSTISGNRAGLAGGGILANGGTLTITNSTITNNRELNNVVGGGGLFRNAGTVSLFNTVVAGNFRADGATNSDVEGTLAAVSANNLIGNAATAGGLTHGTNGNIVGNAGSGTLAIASILNTTLANNGGPTQTHALVAGSLALNAGDNSRATVDGTVGGTALTTDQRGAPFTRIFNTTVDIGAYESQTVNFVVDNNAADVDDGVYTAGNLTLREAVSLANVNPGADTITFSAALNNQSIVLGSTLTLSDSVSITGLGASLLTIDGNDAVRIMTINNGVTASISGLTFTKGIDPTTLGAILNNGNLTLTACLLTNNTQRGVVFNGNTGTLTVESSTFSNNTHLNSAGAILNNGGTLIVRDSTFSGNNGAGRGAIFTSGPATIENSTFNDNSTTGDGGAISHRAGNLTIVNSTFSGNKANQHGGAIATQDGALTVVNSTLTGNRADNDDSATGTGGGYHLLASGTGTAQFFNTIIAGNFVGTGSTADDLGGNAVLAVSANNLVGTSATAGGLTHGTNGNIVGNAGSGTLAIASILNTTRANNGGPTQTHALVSGSLALNAGDNTRATVDGQVGGTALTTDQRGAPFTRIFSTTVDIGAYESQTVNFVVDNNAADVDDGVYTAGNLTLREAVNLANANPGADAITFAAALSGQTITLGSELAITTSITITGLGADRLTISGNNAEQLFQTSVGTVVLEKLTFAQGKADAGSFAGNRGGALHNSGATVTVRDSLFTGNSALASGGAVFQSSGIMSLFNCTFTGNTANGGGALCSVGGTWNVVNCTLSGNTSNGVFGGGAVYSETSAFEIVNSTIVGNRVDSDGVLGTFETGGGVFSFSGSVRLQNTIVAGNIRGPGAGTADDIGTTTLNASSAFNLIGDAATAGGLTHGTNGNIVGNAGSGTLAIASILNTTLANNGGPTQTHALVSGSLALNAGDNTRATVDGQVGSAALTTDGRGTGFDRSIGTAVDIGAFEHQGGIITTQVVQAGTKPTDLQLNVTDVGGNAQLTIVLTAGGVKNAVQLIAGAETFIIGPTQFNLITKGLNVQLFGGNDQLTVNGAGPSVQTIAVDLGLGDDRYIIAGGKTKFTLTDAGGVDTIDFSNQPKKAQIDLAKLARNQNLGNGNKAIVNGQWENVVGGNFGNKLLGNGANNTLTGGNGKDTLDGRDGNDVLIGGLGDDKLIGGNGNDELDGGGGKDKLTSGLGNDILIGGTEDDQLTSTGGFDLLFGGGGKDKLTGAKTGNSLLVGGTTDHDANFAALRLLLAEWSLGTPIANRTANLRAGVGPGNAVRLKKTAVATVADDGAVDTLKTSTGNNWVFLGVGVIDKRQGLQPTDIDE